MKLHFKPINLLNLFLIFVFCAQSIFAPMASSPYRALGNQFKKAYGTASKQSLKTRFQFQNLKSTTDPSKSLLGANIELEDDSFERYRNQALMYGLFHKNNMQKSSLVSDFNVEIGKPSAGDIRLYVGDEGQEHINLVSMLDRSRTSMGSVYLSRILYEPTTDVELLKKRQFLIGGLVNNSEVLQDIQLSLEKISSVSKTFLGFWNDSSKSGRSLETLKSFYPKDNTFLGLFIRSETLENAGKSRVVLGAHSMFQLQKDLSNVASNGLNIAEGLLGMYQEFGNVGKFSGKAAAKKAIKETAEGLIGGMVGSLPFIYPKIKKMQKGFRGKNIVTDDDGLFGSDGKDQSKFAKATVGALMGAFHIYMEVTALKKKHRALKRAHGALLEVSTLVGACEELDRVVKANEELFCSCKHKEKLRRFIDATNEGDLSRLVNLLRSSAFNDEKRKFSPLFFTSILRALNLVNEIKFEFVGALEAIGEIDAFCSLAALVNEHESSSNGFCFANFEENGESHLKVDGVWDPFIDSDSAIPNSMELGGDLKSRNAIISGPNKGGKSTFMRSSMFAVMMAQTCGVAPARSISFSPFSYIDSYVNVEDIAGGCSKFEAEAKRFLKLIENVENMPEGKKSLIIADEMFSGTNPRDAACAGKAVLTERIHKFNDSIWLISTHFPEIREVVKGSGGRSINLHVEVKRKACGELDGEGFTYKILPGETQESTAFDVMRRVGFAVDIMDEARRVRGW